MSYALLSLTKPVARKVHKCIWCGEKILKGEQYYNESSIYEEKFQYHHWHQECNNIITEYMNGEPDFEFNPHEMKRGKPEEL